MLDGIELKQQIGKGAFGSVYRGVNKQGKSFALKKVSKTIKFDETKRIYFNNEIYLLKQVNNDNIIKYVGFKETSSNYYLILEYCNGGSLNNSLNQYMSKNNNSPFPQGIVRFIMKQIINGLVYLHSKHIIHRDLKSDNILLSFPTDVDQNNMNILKATIKIIDFGFARYLRKNEHASSIIGTPLWMDPIILNKGRNKNNKQKCYYSEKCDIWSLGIIAYQLLIGVMPFKGENWDKLYQEVTNNIFTIPQDRKLSKESISFINRLLNVDEEKRPSAFELLSDPFLIGNYNSNTILTVKEDNGCSIKKCFTDFWKETKVTPIVSPKSARNTSQKANIIFSQHKRLETEIINMKSTNRDEKSDNIILKFSKIHTLSIDISNHNLANTMDLKCDTPVIEENMHYIGGEAFVKDHQYAKK